MNNFKFLKHNLSILNDKSSELKYTPLRFDTSLFNSWNNVLTRFERLL